MIFKISPQLIGTKIGKILIILLLAWLAQKGVGLLSKRIKKRLSQTNLSQKKQNQRFQTLNSLITNASQTIIGFLVLLFVLTEIGIDIAPLLAGAGIAGLAIGFGAKTLVADLIAGFFIIFENQFNVGDWVKIANQEGEVTKISLRTITLQDKERKTTYIIPNSSITTVIRYKKTQQKL